MRHLAAALLLILGVPFALAQDPPKTYDLRVPDRWEVGELVTWSSSERGTRSMRMEMGGESEGEAEEVSQESVVVWRCLEVDEKGALRRAHVHVKSWQSRIDDKEDTSIAGAFLEVTPEKWTILSPGIEPSETGREFLDDEFGPDSFAREAVRAELVPAEPVAVGAKWTRSLEVLRELMEDEEGEAPPFDLSQVEIRMSLVDARESPAGVTARLGVEADTPLSGDMTAEGLSLPMQEGSRLQVSGTAEGLLGRSHRSGASDATIHLQLHLDSGDATMAVNMQMKMQSKRAAGGEMPAPPKPAEEAPDPPGSPK